MIVQIYMQRSICDGSELTQFIGTRLLNHLLGRGSLFPSVSFPKTTIGNLFLFGHCCWRWWTACFCFLETTFWRLRKSSSRNFITCSSFFRMRSSIWLKCSINRSSDWIYSKYPSSLELVHPVSTFDAADSSKLLSSFMFKLIRWGFTKCTRCGVFSSISSIATVGQELLQWVFGFFFLRFSSAICCFSRFVV